MPANVTANVRAATRQSACREPRRWLVVGTTGAGKTTLARRLGALLGLPVTELDALHWQPGWQPADREVLRAQVDAITARRGWVVEGGYSHLRDLTWGRAEAVVWLDYPWPIVFGRLLRRTVRRAWRQEVLWNGNREAFANAFASRDSILLWQLRTHWRRRAGYRAWQAGDYAHLTWHPFHHPAGVERWLAGLGAGGEQEGGGGGLPLIRGDRRWGRTGRGAETNSFFLLSQCPKNRRS